MKKNWINCVLYALLISTLSFVGCTDEGDDTGEPESGEIKNLVASLSTNNGRSVRLSFEHLFDSTGEPLGDYDIYHSEDDAEFIKEGNTNNNFYNSNRTKHGKSYRFFVKSEQDDMLYYSDTIDIETAHPAMPWVSTSARVIGEGPGADIEYVRLKFFTGEQETVDVVSKFEYFRDGEKIGEYEVPSIINGNDFEFKDESIDFNFEQEYVYKVVSFTHDGEQIESLEAAISVNVPDVIDRPAPSIEEITSDATEKVIYLHIKDVSESATYANIYAELGDGEWAWEGGDRALSNLDQDEDGNYMFPLSTEGAPGGFKSIKAKAKVTIQGKESDWSAWSVATVFVAF